MRTVTGGNFQSPSLSFSSPIYGWIWRRAKLCIFSAVAKKTSGNMEISKKLKKKSTNKNIIQPVQKRPITSREVKAGADCMTRKMKQEGFRMHSCWNRFSCAFLGLEVGANMELNLHLYKYTSSRTAEIVTYFWQKKTLDKRLWKFSVNKYLKVLQKYF